jgi:hypothetical protein
MFQGISQALGIHCRSAEESGSQDPEQIVGKPYLGIASCLLVILPQRATANRERQGALTESGTTIAGDPFYREWLCGAGQGCRGSKLEPLYIDNCLPLTVELFHQLAFFILSCKPISYCRFKRIDVYIL